MKNNDEPKVGKFGTGVGRPRGFEGGLRCHRCDFAHAEELEWYERPYRLRVVGFSADKVIAAVRYFDTEQQVNAWRVGMRHKYGYSIPTIVSRSDLPVDLHHSFTFDPDGDFEWPFAAPDPSAEDVPDTSYYRFPSDDAVVRDA